MNNRHLYIITHIASGKKYIGQTVDPRHRMRKHFGARSDCPLIGNAVRKYGKEEFEFLILTSNLTPMEANAHEIALIAAIGTKTPHGYNITEGGDGCIGQSPSKITRERMSVAQKNRIHTAEEIENLKQAKMKVFADPNVKKEYADRMAATMARPDVKARTLEGIMRRARTVEHRKRFGEATRKRWADPVARKKMQDALAAARNRKQKQEAHAP